MIETHFLCCVLVGMHFLSCHWRFQLDIPKGQKSHINNVPTRLCLLLSSCEGLYSMSQIEGRLQDQHTDKQQLSTKSRFKL